MFTNPPITSEPPAWMMDNPTAARNSETVDTLDRGEDVTAGGSTKKGDNHGKRRKKKSRRSSVGTTRSSYGGYESEDDDDDEQIEEDCCCCPMDPVLFGVMAFRFICFFLGIAGCVVNIYCMSRPSEREQYQHQILRAYATSFCATIVAVEVDWRVLIKRIKLLDLWIFRGLFYAYAGLQTTGEITSFDFKELARPQDIVGIALFGAGVLYTLMGTCCIKSVTESKRKAAHYREIESV